MLVAVFLRKVEYFAGVIFLTTNLIHMIGESHAYPAFSPVSVLVGAINTCPQIRHLFPE